MVRWVVGSILHWVDPLSYFSFQPVLRRLVDLNQNEVQLRSAHAGQQVNLEKNEGAGRSSEVERLIMVRWVVGSILHGVDPLSYFSFQPVLRRLVDLNQNEVNFAVHMLANK